jgi:hypothetical protein
MTMIALARRARAAGHAELGREVQLLAFLLGAKVARIVAGPDDAFEHDGAPTFLVVERLTDAVETAVRELSNVLGTSIAIELVEERQQRAALLALVVHRRGEVAPALRERMDVLIAERRAPSPFCIVR